MSKATSHKKDKRGREKIYVKNRKLTPKFLFYLFYSGSDESISSSSFY